MAIDQWTQRRALVWWDQVMAGVVMVGVLFELFVPGPEDQPSKEPGPPVLPTNAVGDYARIGVWPLRMPSTASTLLVPASTTPFS